MYLYKIFEIRNHDFLLLFFFIITNFLKNDFYDKKHF